MSKYFVKSGALNQEVDALSHEGALKKSIEAHWPITLGKIAGVRMDGDTEDDEMIFLTTRVLDQLGIQYQEKSKT